MCGIAGFLFSDRYLRNEPNSVLERMTAALAVRGPDDEGHWVDTSAGVALGHRRLSIVDLTPAGHQPMASASGRYIIVFNGEIYNHRAIRRELEETRLADRSVNRDTSGTSWRGTSDTESLLAAIERWGLDRGSFHISGLWRTAEREQPGNISRKQDLMPTDCRVHPSKVRGGC